MCVFLFTFFPQSLLNTSSEDYVSLHPHHCTPWHPSVSFSSASPRCQPHTTLTSFLIHQTMQNVFPNPPFALMELGYMIWREDWIPASSNISGSLGSCLNKMSCFPFGPLMPLWASFCRSPMCHSEIIALDSNLRVDLQITDRQQVSTLSPVRPRWGNPGVGWYWDVFHCFCLSLFFIF